MHQTKLGLSTLPRGARWDIGRQEFLCFASGRNCCARWNAALYCIRPGWNSLLPGLSTGRYIFDQLERLHPGVH